MMSQGRLKRAPSTVYAWFRGLPGLRMETLQQAQDRLWGTQVRLVDYEFTKSRHLAAMRTPDLYFNSRYSLFVAQAAEHGLTLKGPE